MKVLVLYSSKTGFTKAYAELIGEEFNKEVKSLKEVTRNDILDCDIVLYGGGVYAGRINGFGRVKRLLHGTKTKLLVFAVGATSMDNLGYIENLWRANIGNDNLKKIAHFYLQGGINYEELGYFKRKLLKAIANEAYKKNPKDDRRETFNNVKKENLEDLINFLRGKR